MSALTPEQRREVVALVDAATGGDGRWLSVEQACGLWGLESAAVRQRARRGYVQSRKEGSALLVRRPSRGD